MALTHTVSTSANSTEIDTVRPVTVGTDMAATGNMNYVPIVYTKKVLRNFYQSSVFSQICNTDYEGEIKAFGDKVVIRRTPTMNVAPYSVGEGITYQTPSSTSTDLMVDLGIYAAFEVDDVDKAQSDLPLMNIYSKDVAEQIRINVDIEVLAYAMANPDSDNSGNTAGAISGNLALGVTSTPVTITATNATEYIVMLNQVLDEQNIPSEGRWVIIPASFAYALKTSDLKAANITGDSTGVIRSGLIGMIDRMKVYQNNNLPSGTGGGLATGETAIIAGTNEAITFAAQITKTDTLKIPDSFGEYWRTLFVYGRRVVQPEALVVGIVT